MKVNVTVVYATAYVEAEIELTLPPSATVAAAVKASGFVEQWQLAGVDIGFAIFGQRVDAATPLRNGDRIELTRPLRIDAIAARRLRAAKRAARE